MKVDEIITPFLYQLEGKKIFSPEFLHLFTNFANKFKDGYLLQQIAENIRNDTFAFETLAAKSYSHDNGFTKLVLWENQNSMFRLRLHFWDGLNKNNSNIHNHRFNFASFILKGKIKNISWILDEEGNNFGYFHYLPRLEKGAYQMIKIGNAKLRISEEAIFGEGEVYYLDHKTLHTSENCSENTITLFIEERSVLGDYAKVYTNKYLSEGDFILNSPSLEIQNYVELVERISTFLQTK